MVISFLIIKFFKDYFMATVQGSTAPTSQAYLLGERSFIASKFSQIYRSIPNIEKIQKTALKVLIVAAFIGVAAVSCAALAGVMAFPPALGAILALSAASGVFYLIQTKITDYQDPEVLKTLKKEAVMLDWNQLIKRHGIANVLKYEIVDAKRLKELLHVKLEKQSFLGALHLYHKVVQFIVTSSIHPEEVLSVLKMEDVLDWDGKWKSETRGLLLSDIFEHYDLSELQKCKGFDERVLSFLKAAQARLSRAEESYQRRMLDLQENVNQQIRPFQEELEKRLSEAEEAYVAKWDPQRIADIEVDYRTAIIAIMAEKEKTLATLQQTEDQIHHELLRGRVTLERKAKLQNDKELIAKQRIDAEQLQITKKKEAHQAFIERRRLCALEIQSADDVREVCIQKARDEFSVHIAPILIIRNELRAKITADLESLKADLQIDYKNLIR